MKPPSFAYLRPASLDEAKALLGEYGDECKLLAGGQTLVPMMNFRLAGAPTIIDINGIPGLDRILVDDTGLRMGALVRWCRIETSPEIAAANPLLAEAIRHVAHYQIRNRGTWAGSSAHADPAAEFPAIALLCDAEFCIESARETRIVAAEDFFISALTTVLESDEILVEVRFPPWPKSRKWAFEEFAMRSGDFALAGIALTIDDPEGDEPVCRLVSFGVGDRQCRLSGAEAALAEGGLTLDAVALAARAAGEEVEAQDDHHATADYRRALVEALVYRLLCKVLGLKGEQ